MNNETENLLRKIRALRDKANDPSVTEAEAVLFTQKVQELLTKHGLSMADVSSAGAKQQDDLGGTSVEERWKSPARKALLRAVCRFYMCEAVSPGRGSHQWTIVGRPHNVTVALEMADYLIATTIRLSNEYGRKNRGQNVSVVDFRRGCMARLTERLYTMLHEQKKQAAVYTSAGNPGNLPALFKSEAQLIKAELRRMGTVSTKSRTIKQGADAVAGRAAAEKIGLTGQIGGGQRVGRLMIGSK